MRIEEVRAYLETTISAWFLLRVHPGGRKKSLPALLCRGQRNGALPGIHREDREDIAALDIALPGNRMDRLGYRTAGAAATSSMASMIASRMA